MKNAAIWIGGRLSDYLLFGLGRRRSIIVILFQWFLTMVFPVCIHLFHQLLLVMTGDFGICFFNCFFIFTLALM